ncbi:hypothetical protein [Martelella sp. HB161492]|uniref:hypothetical protein n=1 Tax=Martelella sp. HB161492 TaxID=2720726 RepID=UPI001591B4FD|nr:hypothetical protein [Martelella sp. HB161492]
MDVALSERKIKNKKRRSGRGLLATGLVGFMCLGMGAAIGLGVSREAVPSTPNLSLPVDAGIDWLDEICVSFRLFGRGYKPMLDVGPDDPAAVRDLMSRATGLDIRIPAFADKNMIFEGVRIVSINRLPGAELFYRKPTGEPFSVFAIAQSASKDNQITEVNETIRDDIGIAWWQGNAALYAVVAPSSDAEISDIAKSAYLSF